MFNEVKRYARAEMPSANGSRGQPRLSEEVAARLLEMIFAGHWRTGDQLPPERELAAQLGAGRSSLREAIKALEHAGVVVVRRGRTGGTYVAEPSYRQLGGALATVFQMHGFDLAELYQARQIIEPAVAASAAELATEQDRHALARVIEQLEARLQAGEEVAELNTHLHFLIACATHNALLLMLMTSLLDLVRRVTPQGREIRAHTFVQHRALVEAINAGDSARARLLMDQHIREMATERADIRAGNRSTC
jgi:GntR family transcriptional repressor for pyruvate dehydrogenase complex